MKLLLQALLVSLLPLSLAYGEMSLEELENRVKQSETKEEYVKWMQIGINEMIRKGGYSSEELRVEIKIKGSLVTTTYKGDLLKDEGYRSQMFKESSSLAGSTSTYGATAYSLGIRFMSTYLEDGTLLDSSVVTN
jgi:hypothetical protein